MGFVAELLEFVVENVLDTIVEGCYQSKKPVPMIVRVLLLLIILAAYLGLAGGCMYIAYLAWLNADVWMGLLFAALGFIIITLGIWEVRKIFKRKDA